MTQKNFFKIVVGSWGSYNACNSRALGSRWLTLNDFTSWEEIEVELIKEGFELDGIDEELFIQDYDTVVNVSNCDYVHPKKLFELLKDSEVLEDEEKYKKMIAYCDALSWDDFRHLVERKGEFWDDDVYLYEDMDMLDVAYDIVDSCGYLQQMPEYLRDYFDYQRYADDLKRNNFYEVKNGVIEIY